MKKEKPEAFLKRCEIKAGKRITSPKLLRRLFGVSVEKYEELERSNASLQKEVAGMRKNIDFIERKKAEYYNRAGEAEAKLASLKEKYTRLVCPICRETIYYAKKKERRAGELAGLAKVVAEWTRVFYEDYERDYPEKLKEFGVWLERKKSELEGKEG